MPTKTKINVKKAKSGFSLIELVVVLLVISVICQAGVAAYRDLTFDSSYETASAEINAFFNTCKQISKLRCLELNIVLKNNSFVALEDSNVNLRLNNAFCDNFPKMVMFNDMGELFINNSHIEKFILPIRFGKGKIASIAISI